jgi:NADPH:quinone reductase-like Zn-dependent oxidoreductase
MFARWPPGALTSRSTSPGAGCCPEHVITVADFAGAQQSGVRFSRGDSGRALHAIGEIGALIESGRFALRVGRTFPLAEVAEAQRVSEHGHVAGKIVLLVG